MQPTCSWVTYESRLRRVTAYIHDHLMEDLDMEKLGEIACLSPYHWHRIYRAVHGETLAATVKRLRLQRAAVALSQGGRSVQEIAIDSGYPNLQSFSRTFKSAYGVPPSQFRSSGSHVTLNDAILRGDATMYEVTFRDTEPVDAVGVDHTGSYHAIGKAFETLGGLMYSRQLFQPGATMYGVYYDDPEGTPVDELRSTACFSFDGPGVAIDPPLRRLRIAGGRYAVLRHKGPYSDLQLAYRWLYQQWLQSANVEIRDEPPIEIYVNTPQDTPPQDLLTDICIPVVSGFGGCGGPSSALPATFSP